MGKAQKKFGKGRLDHYYRLAKEKGYRARSSFKIIQINEKFGHFLEKSKVVIDLCAAPGSWCQVASQLCPVNSLIIGVDLVAIKPLPNVITFQSDITTEHCRSQLRGHMKTWKADVVMHDGAPNVGLAWAQDAFTQSQLVLMALKLAVEFLAPNGVFVTKVFRSKDYNNLMWVFMQFFNKVEATKPPSSRNVSAEIFVVCQGFKAPKKYDPRLLDPKEVFEELPEGPQNLEAKVYNPEQKKRKRDGYEEGDYTQFSTVSALEFIKAEDPIAILGTKSQLTVEELREDPEWKPVRKLKQSTPELFECLKDLKVLGRKEFRSILRWRLAARAVLGLDAQTNQGDLKSELAAPPTEEEQIEAELKALREKQMQKRKREKRKENETKQKEIQRMQLHMISPMELGVDAAAQGRDSLFNLKAAEQTGELDGIARGRRAMVFSPAELQDDADVRVDSDSASSGAEDSEAEADALEEQLDAMYESYKERKAERDARYRARKAREAAGKEFDDEWDGITEMGSPSAPNGYDSEDAEEESDLEDASDSDNGSQKSRGKLISVENGLSRRAAVFFADSIFSEFDDEPGKITEVTEEQNGNGKVNSSKFETVKEKKPSKPVDSGTPSQLAYESESADDSESDFELENSESDSESDTETTPGDYRTPTPGHAVEIVTPQAMTLAHDLALKRKTVQAVADEGFNRYSFRDSDGLPEWFIEDEAEHSKLIKPITKEAALAIKAKSKALNARPIKKVLEAQGRKKLRAARRLEKLRKKSDLINEDGDKSELEKANEISKLMGKMAKKKPKPKVTVVVARGQNKRLMGRPRGVKGKYKMVDGTLKKEQRALKRIAKKRRKGK